MSSFSPVFFCAVGGSGMLPLALILKARGFDVRGSDRSFDQGRTPERFDFIKSQGILLFPQDGSGISTDLAKLVVSTAIEETVPDYAAAKQMGIPIVHRAAQLAELFNASKTSLAIAGTSGKSTTTGMIGWILHDTGREPTIMNGAVMKNFMDSGSPFASAIVGNPDLFVSEVDESDGSIALFRPTIAILNNIALDHKSMSELRALFHDFLVRADKAILNLDNEEVFSLASRLPTEKAFTYSLCRPEASLFAHELRFRPDGTDFNVTAGQTQETVSVNLNVPGRHNVSNALAALAAACTLNVPLKEAAKSLSNFAGISRRLDIVGTVRDVTVIDDFAHNPDKIAASLNTLHQAAGRLLILFQPHGYGPLRLMRKELTACFAEGLDEDDRLFLPDPLYLGGTTNRDVTSQDLAGDIAALGRAATFLSTREACVEAILQIVQPGDRVVVMGARDDTLTTLAQDLLKRLS